MNLTNPIETVIPSLEGQVFVVLSRTTTPLAGRQIARLSADGSYAGIMKALNRLAAVGIVHARSSSHATLYEANREHVLWSITEQLVQEVERSLATVRGRIVSLIQRETNDGGNGVVTLALYGSTARGNSTQSSDIDLVALFPDDFSESLRETVVDRLTTEVPIWTGNRCNVYALSRSGLAGLAEASDSMISTWVAESKTFYGPDLKELIEAARSRLGRRDHA